MSASEHIRALPPDREATIARLQLHLSDLRAKYGIVRIGLFGSFVREQNNDPGDIDVLVEFGDGPVSLFDFIALRNELAEILGAHVDLVEREALKPTVADRVLREVLYL